MSTVVAWYREPLFWWFPVGSFAVSIVAFILFAAPLTWIAWRDPLWARRYRLQSRAPREPASSAHRSLWLGTTVPRYRYDRGRPSCDERVCIPPVPAGGSSSRSRLPLVLTISSLLVHRPMHAAGSPSRAGGTIARERWRSWTLQHPWSRSPARGAIGPLLVGAHVVTLWIWLAFRQWEAAEGHCGYEFAVTPTHLFPGNDGARHHDFHHARVRGNYAGFFPIWDRVFGTYAKGYAEVVAGRSR